ncbi:VOC family protein, partial [Neptunicella sp.]|uniref:VOC family protein n=1 Tax=Neptunicella sp. TaxID=2125986 RepID=UPI003F6922E7
MQTMNPFHLAIPVTSLELSRQFYGDIIGCQQGRSSAQWIDWNFFGHQLVTHLVAEMPSAPQHNAVDNHAVPVPHFGIVLDKPSWQQLADTLIAA